MLTGVDLRTIEYRLCLRNLPLQAGIEHLTIGWGGGGDLANSKCTLKNVQIRCQEKGLIGLFSRNNQK